MAAGDRTRLGTLVALESWRRIVRRLRSGPVYRWRYTGRTPDRVLIAPPDLRFADSRLAAEMYRGRFALSGHSVETAGRSPFAIDVGNRGWRNSLHGFRWLRHMRAADTELAAANARALVSDWIAIHGSRISGDAWTPATTAKRVIAWLQHSSIVLQGADFVFYRSFLRSLALQIRYLRSVAPQMPETKDRLRARIALAYAALSLPAPPSALRLATQHLGEEIERQILPDGGHISRNPMALLDLLADLLPLRQTYANQAEAPPAALMGAVERMAPALRFFRHRDGGLAHFNGMGFTIHERVAAVLRHDDTGGAPLLHAPHSGYDRLSMGATTVIADTGQAPPLAVSQAAHAGFLSFELSSGGQQFIVNSGVDTFGAEAFRPLGRATAAHSTASIDDTSSARFNHSPRLAGVIGAALVGGPTRISCTRFDRAGLQGFVARHDGYVARFGIEHEREMTLGDNGDRISGVDRFIRDDLRRGPRGDAETIAIRFHLHPDVQLFRDARGRLVLAPARGDRWFFSCDDPEPKVEDSIFFAAPGGPRRSRQVLLAFKDASLAEVRWQLQRRAGGAGIPDA